MSMTDDFGHGTVADQNAINMSGHVVSGIFAPAEKLSPSWGVLFMAASLLKNTIDILGHFVNGCSAPQNILLTIWVIV